MALPADPGSLQGWDPSMALVGELHVVTDDTFEAISARAGKRDRSLLLAISTPPKAGDDGVMRRLVDHGREGADPSFYFTEFAAPAGCAVDDEAAWTIAADPFRWARSLQLLDGEGLPVLEYPQSPGRMTPATARFYEAVVNGQLTRSGDSRLARHVGNAVLREDARGARLAKERRDSPPPH
jgi:phage terminase large subunit-like protein